jgi:adenylate cyclase
MTGWAFQWTDDPQIPERAAGLARRAVALDDALPGAHQTLAYVYLLKKEFDQALAEAERAVALDPNDADACVTLGEVLSCMGKSQEAVDLVEKALRLDPHYPPSYLFALGQAYYFIGRHQEAITAFKRLLTRNPDHLRTRFFLAMVYNETGRREEAREEIEACKSLNPSLYIQRMRQIIPYKDQSLVDRWLNTLVELGVKRVSD